MKIGRYTGIAYRRTPVPNPKYIPEQEPKKSTPAPKKSTPAPNATSPDPDPPPKKKALLIGISTAVGYAQLKGPHGDVALMRGLLVEKYGYAEGDIVTLLDGEEDGIGDVKGIQPTRVNILRAIGDLVRGARRGDRFFFHYCGHTTQVENRSNSEEDGMDECLVPLDGEAGMIMDNELRRHLIDPLPVGSTLVAVFDSCHSASLLDLAHFRCNRVYVPWLSKHRRKSDEQFAARWEAVDLRFLARISSHVRVAVQFGAVRCRSLRFGFGWGLGMVCRQGLRFVSCPAAPLSSSKRLGKARTSKQGCVAAWGCIISKEGWR
ncbi:caspase domain-containing protein [Mycena epipterygia]|nr:caspase domain-containing protein [Mycena epipterygia]